MKDLFTNISTEERKELLRTLDAETSSFPSGVIVFDETLKDTIGIIQSGIVQIIRNDYNGDRIIIEELSKGQIFGSSISSITSSDYEVISVSPTTITFFEFENIYKKELKEHRAFSTLASNLIEIMGDIIISKNERVHVLSKKTIRERLLEYFTMVSKKQKSKKIVLPFTYTELADYLGINRSAMYRELQNLKQEKMIEINKKTIQILYI